MSDIPTENFVEFYKKTFNEVANKFFESFEKSNYGGMKRINAVLATI